MIASFLMKSNFLCLQLKYASSVLLLMVTLLNIVYFFQSTLIVKRLTMKVGLNREYSESHQIVIQKWTSTVNKNSTGVAGRYVFQLYIVLKGSKSISLYTDLSLLKLILDPTLSYHFAAV